MMNYSTTRPVAVAYRASTESFCQTGYPVYWLLAAPVWSKDVSGNACIMPRDEVSHFEETVEQH